VYAGAPSDASGYNLTVVGDLPVYVHKDIRVANEGLRLRLKKLGPSERLILEGFLT
jgi:hypothetical protein